MNVTQYYCLCCQSLKDAQQHGEVTVLRTGFKAIHGVTYPVVICGGGNWDDIMDHWSTPLAFAQ